MANENEIDVLKDVVERLERAGLAYMLTGSFAMNYYVTPRMTRDIDLVVALAAKDSRTISELLSPDYYVSDDAVKNAIARESTFNALHLASVVKVDFIVRKQSEYRLQEFERRRRHSLGDFKVWIASKEDLAISKLWWAKDSRSELQFRDVRNLLATDYDHPYLEEWIKRLGLDEIWKECQRG